jgi:hypothetical protein
VGSQWGCSATPGRPRTPNARRARSPRSPRTAAAPKTRTFRPSSDDSLIKVRLPLRVGQAHKAIPLVARLFVGAIVRSALGLRHAFPCRPPLAVALALIANARAFKTRRAQAAAVLSAQKSAGRHTCRAALAALTGLGQAGATHVCFECLVSCVLYVFCYISGSPPCTCGTCDTCTCSCTTPR